MVALTDFRCRSPRPPARVNRGGVERGSASTTAANWCSASSPVPARCAYRSAAMSRAAAPRPHRVPPRGAGHHARIRTPVQSGYGIRHVFDLVVRNSTIVENRADARRLVHEAGVRRTGARADPLSYPQLSGGGAPAGHGRRAFCGASLIVADEPFSMVDARSGRRPRVMSGLKTSSACRSCTSPRPVPSTGGR